MSDEIVLRPLELADIDEEYCSWYSNSDGHLNFFTGSGRHFDRDVLVKDFEEGLRTQRWYYYLVLSASGEKIGNVKVGPIDTRHRTSDLVCLIGNRNFLGKGMATKAIVAANRIAFEKHDIRRLHGGMYASNIPSIKAYTRAGWVIEATFKGFYLVDGRSEDRVCVACFNPAYFESEDMYHE